LAYPVFAVDAGGREIDMAKRRLLVQVSNWFSEPPTQASLFHYIRQARTEPFRWRNLVEDLAVSFRSPFFIPSLFDNPDRFLASKTQLRTRRMEAVLFSILVHASIVLAAILLIRNGTGNVPVKEITVSLNGPFFDLPFADRGKGGGGGGGGREEQAPPTWGRFPNGNQLVVPDPQEPRPLLPPDEAQAAAESVSAQIDLHQDESLPIGDPAAPHGISRSRGPGSRDGIGTGDGTGGGPGKGSGYGPGENGGTGGGRDGTVGNSGDGIFRMGVAGLIYPEILFDPKPAYTEEARKARVEGIVLIQAIVRKDGTVDGFKIVRGLGHGLDESAIQTIASKWRFKPGKYKGAPVDVQANIEVSFRLY
jgi:TonB family protein